MVAAVVASRVRIPASCQTLCIYMYSPYLREQYIYVQYCTFKDDLTHCRYPPTPPSTPVCCAALNLVLFQLTLFYIKDEIDYLASPDPYLSPVARPSRRFVESQVQLHLSIKNLYRLKP